MLDDAKGTNARGSHRSLTLTRILPIFGDWRVWTLNQSLQVPCSANRRSSARTASCIPQANVHSLAYIYRHHNIFPFVPRSITTPCNCALIILPHFVFVYTLHKLLRIVGFLLNSVNISL